MPIVVVMFAMGAAMGQFGCYAYDGALRLSFSKLSNKTGVMIPTGIDVLFNILRATSLFHIFYGFCLLLVFHLSLIFMIQSSMREFNGKRDFPIQNSLSYFFSTEISRQGLIEIKSLLRLSGKYSTCLFKISFVS